MPRPFRQYGPFLFLAAIFLFGQVCGPAGTPAWAASNEQELFLVAQKAFDDGFYDVSIRYIEQFLQKYPLSDQKTKARLLLGQCYFFKSQYLKAFDIFQTLLQSPDQKDATLYWLGETYFKGGDYQQAEKEYKKVLAQYPKSDYLPQCLYSLGWAYYQLGDYKNASHYFKKLADEFPSHTLSEDAHFKIGECAQNINDYRGAIHDFDTFINRYPQSAHLPDAYFYIAESYYYLGDYLTAVTYYAKAENTATGSHLKFISEVSMGWCYLKLKKYDLSKKYFETAKTSAQANNFSADDVYLGMAHLFSETGERQKAEAAYTELIKKFPNSPRIAQAHLGKANTDYLLENYKSAVSEYQWIIDHYQKDKTRHRLVEKAYYGLAWTYLKEGAIGQSVASFQKIYDQAESQNVKVSALTQIGDAYQEAHQLVRALQVYDRILKDYPDSVYTDYVQFRQGIALLKLNKIAAATLSFQTLQANFPQSKYCDESQYYLGVAYFKKGDWPQAIQHINTYLARVPKSEVFESQANYILAISDFQIKNYNKALDLFQKLVKTDPQDKPLLEMSRFNIAKCKYHLKQVKAARKDMKAILDEFPESEAAQQALLWLGDHYLESNDLDTAILYYQQFLDQFPGSPKVDVVRYEIGQAYQAQNDLEKALNSYKLIDTADKAVYAKAQLAIADIFAKDKTPQDALQAYHAIITKAPEFQRDAYMKIGRIHEDQKNIREAIQDYRQGLKAPQGLSRISNAELQFRIADAFEILNQPDKAVDAYLKVPYLYPTETAWIIKSYLRVGRIFEEKEKWSEAITTYQKILKYHVEEAKYAKERINWIKQNTTKP